MYEQLAKGRKACKTQTSTVYYVFETLTGPAGILFMKCTYKLLIIIMITTLQAFFETFTPSTLRVCVFGPLLCFSHNYFELENPMGKANFGGILDG